MKTFIITENQKGLVFKNGKFVKILHAGKARQHRNETIEVVDLSAPLRSNYAHVDTLMENEEIRALTVTAEIGDEELGLHYVNGTFASALPKGKFIFWNVHDKHEVKTVDISSPIVDSSIPKHVFASIPHTYFTTFSIRPHMKARLYFDEKLVALLEPGVYYYWKCSTNVKCEPIDTRMIRLDVNGQELLTKDKVGIRINFVTNYRVTDYVKVVNEIDDYEEQIHVSAQLALRDFVGKYTLDEILEMKEEMSSYVTERLKEREKTLYVEISDSGVKDIILPGAIREIMNTVLVAEKRAQANVITRREEVASTRSLLNTAKLIEENKTLQRL